MLKTFNRKHLIKDNFQKQRNKFSISIYSNPFNINFPFEGNKINHNQILSNYKRTSEKIQNMYTNISNSNNKLTVSNILSILHSNDSQCNPSINYSLRNNILIKQITKKYKLPAKNSIREKSFNHFKAISINNKNRSEFSKDKLLNEKNIKKIRINIKSKLNKRNTFSFRNETKENIKSTSKDKIEHNKNKSINKKENIIIHQKKPSITYRNFSNKKKEKINKIPINKIINKIRSNNIKQFFPSNTKNNIPNLRRNSMSKEKIKDLSIGKERKKTYSKNTENTQYTTLKKENINLRNIFEDLNNSNDENNEFDKLQNDLDSLIRKIDFNNINHHLNILEQDDKDYLNYKKHFNKTFENCLKTD